MYNDHAVYYPHIDLINKNWIKTTMLFWGKISRIIPASYIPQDSEDIIYIKNESDFIQDYALSESDISFAASEFLEVLDKFMLARGYIKKSDLSIKRRTTSIPTPVFRDKGINQKVLENSGTYIHIDKINNKVFDKLCQYGLVIKDKRYLDGWIRIKSEIGFLYMNYLANAVSEYYKRPIITDVDESFLDSALFRSLGYRNYNHELTYNIGSVLIDIAVPKNINNIHISKVIQIRNALEYERNAFFRKIGKFTDSVGIISSAEELSEKTAYFSKNIKQEIRNFEKIYHSFGIEVIQKFLSVSLPTTLSSIADFVPNEYSPFIATGGVLVGIITAINGSIKEKAILKQNPYSYLFDLKSALSKESFFQRAYDRLTGYHIPTILSYSSKD